MYIFTKEFREGVYKFCKWMPSVYVAVILLLVQAFILFPVGIMSINGAVTICDSINKTYGFVDCTDSLIGSIIVIVMGAWSLLMCIITSLAIIIVIAKAIEIALDREFDPAHAWYGSGKSPPMPKQVEVFCKSKPEKKLDDELR